MVIKDPKKHVEYDPMVGVKWSGRASLPLKPRRRWCRTS